MGSDWFWSTVSFIKIKVHICLAFQGTTLDFADLNWSLIYLYESFLSQTWRLCVFVLGRPPPKYQNSPRSVAPQPLNIAVSSPYSNARSFLRFPSPSTIKGLFEEWKSLKTRIPLFEWHGQSKMLHLWACYIYCKYLMVHRDTKFLPFVHWLSTRLHSLIQIESLEQSMMQFLCAVLHWFMHVISGSL